MYVYVDAYTNVRECTCIVCMLVVCMYMYIVHTCTCICNTVHTICHVSVPCPGTVRNTDWTLLPVTMVMLVLLTLPDSAVTILNGNNYYNVHVLSLLRYIILYVYTCMYMYMYNTNNVHVHPFRL